MRGKHILETLFFNPVYGYLLIFAARVVDVSLDVLRLLMLTRGYYMVAAIFGFFEVAVFVLVLGAVISGGSMDPLKIIAYAGGFATGNIVGALIEEKTAVGYVVVQVFPIKSCSEEMACRLREKNYGVTKIAGEGRSGMREVLIVTAKRKYLPGIINTINEVEPDTFFNISDIRSIHGGVFPRRRP